MLSESISLVRINYVFQWRKGGLGLHRLIIWLNLLNVSFGGGCNAIILFGLLACMTNILKVSIWLWCLKVNHLLCGEGW